MLSAERGASLAKFYREERTRVGWSMVVSTMMACGGMEVLWASSLVHLCRVRFSGSRHD
jgi:hypothetical protein